MQKFLIKQGVSVAICLTIALSVCAYSAAGTLAGAGITIAAEMSTREAQSFERKAPDKTESFNANQKSNNEFSLLSNGETEAEITQAIVPEA